MVAGPALRVHGPMVGAPPAPRAWIGISGYNYRGWRGNFYPARLPAREWLGYASRHFNSIELNSTFYSLKSPAIYRRWADATPDGFVFAIKGSRFITHNLKLARAGPALANFFASGILALGERTGPLLWQLPGTYRFDPERMTRFFELLPRSASDAAALAAGHNPAQVPDPELTPAADLPFRHALEARHPSCFTPEALDLLRAWDIALVIADTAGRFPREDVLTGDFVYVRLHGSTHLYASRYEDRELDRWTRHLVEWSTAGGITRDVFVYFDNDALGHAPHDALRLAQRVRAAGLEVDWTWGVPC